MLEIIILLIAICAIYLLYRKDPYKNYKILNALLFLPLATIAAIKLLVDKIKK